MLALLGASQQTQRGRLHYTEGENETGTARGSLVLGARTRHAWPMSREESPEATSAPAHVIETLVSNHRQFLAFVERRVGSRAAAEDILHNAFVRGIQKGAALREEDSALAWFYQTLRHAVIDYHRRHAATGRQLDRFAAEMATQSQADAEMHREICRCIGQLAETLKPEYARALKRIEIEGVAVKDFALESGISTSNAAVRVFRARQALRQQVARSCGTCAEHGCLDCSCDKAPRTD